MSRLFITEYRTRQGLFSGPSISALTFREAEGIARRLVMSGDEADDQDTIPLKVLGYMDGDALETIDYGTDIGKATHHIQRVSQHVNKMLGLKPAVPRCLDCKIVLPPDVFHLCGVCETRRQEVG
jgi:hypothetical protein